MTQRRLSADKALPTATAGTCPPSALASPASGLVVTGSTAGSHDLGDDAATVSNVSGDGGAQKDLEHNVVSFGKWFFFCQHCRHGGHANCIDQWFGGTGDICREVNSSNTAQAAGYGEVSTYGMNGPPRKRTVCGVNGCECHCIARL